MGLDVVEIVLRTEEVFGIDIPDEEAGSAVTVGDLYRLVLKKLDIPYQPVSEQNGRDRSRLPASTTTSWSAADVWVTLKAIIQYQLQVNADDVREGTAFLKDLGAE